MTLQEQPRASGEPTRHGIFRYIADSGRLVDVAELTSHFELDHDAIRQHLPKLVGAGLVTGPYQRLSMLLVDMLASGSTAEKAGRRPGRRPEVGYPETPDDRITALQETIARRGFEPKMRGGGDTIGLSKGLANQLEGVTVDDLVRRNPHRAGCSLRFSLDLSDGGTATP
ncbi:MAG TPA: helix-turn-helix transcriptional regulator [Acidimicrobiia bacterium]